MMPPTHVVTALQLAALRFVRDRLGQLAMAAAWRVELLERPARDRKRADAWNREVSQ